MSRIDSQTAAQVHKVLELARFRGMDPVALLDRAGFLRYPAKTFEDQRVILYEVTEQTRKLTDILEPGDRLPRNRLDVKNVAVRYLEQVRERFVREFAKKL